MPKEISPGKAELIARKKASEAMVKAMCDHCGEPKGSNPCCPELEDSDQKKYIKMKKAAAQELMADCNACNEDNGDCCSTVEVMMYPEDSTTEEKILMALENNGRRMDAILETMCCQHKDMQTGLVGIVQVIASCFADLCKCVCPGEVGKVTTDDAVFIKPETPTSSCGCD